MFTRSDEYTELMYSVIEEHSDLHWIKGLVKIDCLRSGKKKKSSGKIVFAECIKVPELYREYCPYDFLIVFYVQNCFGMTSAQMRILMYHELLHVGVREKDGEFIYEVNPHDIEDFRKVIDRYGLDWAGR